MTDKNYKYLHKINSPSDLKALPKRAMRPLAGEIRDFLCRKVSKTGGHLASNLGVVEIGMAIHRIFDSPHDHIIWDVGHQSYVHKLLTGRRDRFDTLRQPGGLSGFTKREESEHDPFGAGHSSTSVSAALGFAEADRLAGNDNYTIAVLGDGAFTGGMVHEALNNCHENLRLIIILNENEMSISKNIGSFAHYIARIRSKEKYSQTKNVAREMTQSIPVIGNELYGIMRDAKKAVKDILYSSNYFENMGLFYLGPADGNDYEQVESLLRIAKSSARCTVIHLKTKKGCGFVPAEKNPGKYHSVSPKKSPEATFSSTMGEMLARMADGNDKICAITAAMKDGTGLAQFAKKHPERFFDVGIAEEHALTFAAGLSASGMKPYFAVYSSFLQRGYDNLIHDIALQSLPVTLCIDRAGLAASDGPTHNGIFDVAFLAQIPSFGIFAPATYSSLRRAMRVSCESGVPCAIRYENGSESEKIKQAFYPNGDDFTWVHADGDLSDKDCVIITYGKIAQEALKAKELLGDDGISCGVILLERLSPWDMIAKQIVGMLPDKECAVVFLEEGIYNGGAAMTLKDRMYLPEHQYKMHNKKVAIRAIEDPFAPSREKESVYRTHRISCDDVVSTVHNILSH